MERWKENRGEEGRAGNGWMTSRNGVVRKFTYSTEWRRITARGERWCGRHWTPTGAEQWMDIPIVFQLHNRNYFCQGHKIQNTLNVFQIQSFNYLYFNYSNTVDY